MIEKESETFWKQICHGGLFLSLWWPCSKRNKQQNIILANLSTASHHLGFCHRADDAFWFTGPPWLMNLDGHKKYIKKIGIYFHAVKVFPINISSTCLRAWFLTSSTNLPMLFSPNKDRVSVKVMLVWYSVVDWDKPLSKMGFIHTSLPQCSLLHCSLMVLTLANTQSVIYDQTPPEPGIYYPLQLSVRLHYITPLFISVCQAEMHRRKKYAVKSSLTQA